MAKPFQRQRNIEIIALDYLRIAKVNSMEELKKTDYWKHYQRELALATGTIYHEPVKSSKNDFEVKIDKSMRQFLKRFSERF